MNKNTTRSPEAAIRNGILLALISLSIMASPPQAGAVVGAPRPAAILVFPFVAAAPPATDTLIEIANTSASQIAIRCAYVNGIGRCADNPDTVCARDEQCGPSGTCEGLWARQEFIIPITPNQAVSFRASYQTVALSDRFMGELRCIELGISDLKPVARNDLIGTATRIGTGFADDFRAASHPAVGIEAVGWNDGSNLLCLGSNPSAGCPRAEYSPCPRSLYATHFAGEADVEGRLTRSTDAGLVVTPCSQDFLNNAPVSALAYVEFHNEFEEVFTRSEQIDCWGFIPFSAFLTVGTVGTLTVQTNIQGFTLDGSATQPLIGLVVEGYDGPDGSDETVHGMTSFGLSDQGDVIGLPPYP